MKCKHPNVVERAFATARGKAKRDTICTVCGARGVKQAEEPTEPTPEPSPAEPPDE